MTDPKPRLFRSAAWQALKPSFHGAFEWASLIGSVLLFLFLLFTGKEFGPFQNESTNTALGAISGFLSAFLVLFISRLFKALRTMYVTEWERGESAERHIARLTTPQLSFTFDKAIPGCYPSAPIATLLNAEGAMSVTKSGRWIRIKCDAVNLAAVDGCYARLVKLTHNWLVLFDDSDIVRLPFAPAGQPDSYAKTIRRGHSEYLDLLAITPSNQVNVATYLCVSPSSINLQSLIVARGTYELAISFVATNAPPESIVVTLHWTGDINTSSITCARARAAI